MKMLHIAIGPDDAAEYAMVPGNPDRCAKIAAFLDEPQKVAQNREHTTYAGYLDGQRILVVSTGMGGPSTAICMEELARIGVGTFIRVGTCASTSASVGIGGVVIPNGAVRMEGTGLQYLPLEFPAVPDFGLLKSLEEASLGLGYDSVIGVVIQKDSFYTEIDPETKPVAYDLIPRWNAYLAGGAVATDMESATLYLVAASLGLRAATVLVSATSYGQESAKDVSASAYPTEFEERAIRVAVEALRLQIISDRERSRE
jgi:uridine phosphorylase